MEVDKIKRDRTVTSPTPQTSVFEKASPQEKHMSEVKEGEDNKERPNSPTNSQKTISDDDEIDYSIKPEFYDPTLDDKDEIWVQTRRRGPCSDAVLNCPACFTTVCLECQRHEKYVTQYRAIFVVNCKIEINDVSQFGSLKRKRRRQKKALCAIDSSSVTGETFNKVCCSVCSTEIGVIDEEEVYHFFNVLPSEC